MIPVATEGATGVLTLNDEEGNRIPSADLPFERCVDEKGNHVFETTWAPDSGERKALANGAPVLLRIWGSGHPPVSVRAGEPGMDAEALVSKADGARALAFVYTQLREHLGGDLERELVEALPQPGELLGWWERGLNLVAASLAVEPDAADGSVPHGTDAASRRVAEETDRLLADEPDDAS